MLVGTVPRAHVSFQVHGSTTMREFCQKLLKERRGLADYRVQLPVCGDVRRLVE